MYPGNRGPQGRQRSPGWDQADCRTPVAIWGPVSSSQQRCGAEVLCKYADDWVQAFGKEAHVRMLTWGVVAHGMSTQTMDLSPERLRTTADLLRGENQHTWGKDAENLHLSWLVKPRESKREGSIVIEFTSPVVANRTIDMGTIREAQVHSTGIFCREGRSKLCPK